jgi:hypothetical protein
MDFDDFDMVKTWLGVGSLRYLLLEWHGCRRHIRPKTKKGKPSIIAMASLATILGIWD